MKVGITIGKFMPLHKGHELMLDFGAAMMDKLYVVVSGTEQDEIPLIKRYNWVKEYTAKYHNVAVIYHTDNSPTPSNIDENGTVLDKDFQKYWKQEFSRIAPDATHFVSSDAYGKTMANLLNIEWLPVDPKREMVNISATAIRNDPVTFFDYISDVAKPHYTKKIAIVGPESSGKSTMTKQLAEHFNGAIVTEYGRTLSEVKELNKEDFLTIMRGQQVLVDIATKKATVVFVDTEAYTTYLFSKIYLDEYAENINGKYQEIDHYIVLSPDVEWIDDGTRVLPNQKDREQFFNDILNLLKADKKSYTVINGKDYSSRYKQAMEITYAIST